MKQDKVIRHIGGALLTSGLTNRELMEVSDRLLHDHQFLERLAFVIHTLTGVTERDVRVPLTTVGDPFSGDIDTLVDQIVDIFRRKRVRKTYALNLLAEVAKFYIERWSPDGEETLRDNVESLLDLVSAKDIPEFIRRISEKLNVASDPYLRKML